MEALSCRALPVQTIHEIAPAQRLPEKAAFKKLGVGSGALVAPGNGRKSSTVLTIAIPPIAVTHW
jgi:hypothetical protein